MLRKAISSRSEEYGSKIFIIWIGYRIGPRKCYGILDDTEKMVNFLRMAKGDEEL